MNIFIYIYLQFTPLIKVSEEGLLPLLLLFQNLFSPKLFFFNHHFKDILNYIFILYYKINVA